MTEEPCREFIGETKMTGDEPVIMDTHQWEEVVPISVGKGRKFSSVSSVRKQVSLTSRTVTIIH